MCKKNSVITFRVSDDTLSYLERCEFASVHLAAREIVERVLRDEGCPPDGQPPSADSSLTTLEYAIREVLARVQAMRRGSGGVA